MEGLKAALDSTKQVITLSTTVIALTITFLEKVVDTKAVDGTRHAPTSLKIAWVSFGVAILCGLWTLNAITGTMNAADRVTRGDADVNQRDKDAAKDLANAPNVRVPAMAMYAVFLLAIGLTIVSGLFL